jgi:hypothetical protein
MILAVKVSSPTPQRLYVGSLQRELYLPLPFFGLIPLWNASPEYVFMHKAQPNNT